MFNFFTNSLYFKKYNLITKIQLNMYRLKSTLISKMRVSSIWRLAWSDGAGGGYIPEGGSSAGDNRDRVHCVVVLDPETVVLQN